MENFFYEDGFYPDLDFLIVDIVDDEVEDLPDDWSITVIQGELEPMFQLKEEHVIDAIFNVGADRFEERWPEDPERQDEEFRAAIKSSIDMDKLNSLVPKLYYPSDQTFTITKQDLLDAC